MNKRKNSAQFIFEFVWFVGVPRGMAEESLAVTWVEKLVGRYRHKRLWPHAVLSQHGCFKIITHIYKPLEKLDRTPIHHHAKMKLKTPQQDQKFQAYSQCRDPSLQLSQID